MVEREGEGGDMEEEELRHYLDHTNSFKNRCNAIVIYVQELNPLNTIFFFTILFFSFLF